MRLIGWLVSCCLVGCIGTIEDVGGPIDFDDEPPGEPAPGTPPGQPPGNPPSGSLTYAADIAPKLTFCAGCHAKANPDGDYRTDSYAGLIDGGKDNIANVIGGDAKSLLVEYLAPPPGKNHKNAGTAVPGIGALVRAWVVDHGAAQ
jgi:hypothetical protein